MTKVGVKMKKKIKFEYDEIRVLIIALSELRNRLIEENRCTGAVDELLVRLLD